MKIKAGILFIFLLLNSINLFAKDHKKQIKCLADNIYHEAKGEPLKGQLGVAFVTLNRTKSSKYPDDICKVVYQPGQFSWTRKKRLTRPKGSEYNEIMNLAEHFYHNHHEIKDVTNGSLFFHATYVKPKWKNVKKSIKIGGHIFYKSKGAS